MTPIVDHGRFKMKVLLVGAARPNFMKIAPLMAALERHGIEHVLVHTGQHYDYGMSQTFFDELEMGAPKYHLGVGSGTHAAQTAAVMTGFEPVLLAERPDWVVVPGDVNSTLACALVAVKLKEETGARLAHLEAGLRSHDWRMPEEVNRVLTDRCSDLLLIPSEDARENLLHEGIAADRIAFIGNIMMDTLFARLEAARVLDMPARVGVDRGNFVAATLHRPSNVDNTESLRVCLEALAAISTEIPVVLPIHPRTRKQAEEFGLGPMLGRIKTLEPLGYTEMLSLTDAAAVVLTDSGGLQEETTALGVPCVTLREQTERPITVLLGTNRLAPWPLTVGGIVSAFDNARAQGRRAARESCPDGWDGNAAERVVRALSTA